MFKVEIKNLCIRANIGITAQERKQKQLLKVTLSFNYSVKNSLNLNNIDNVKDYSSITKYLKKLIKDSKSHTLEHLITKTSKSLEKKFNIKDLKIRINKTAVSKKYGAESVSVSN
tara:strand:+ start:239 stop:583 length:345 start_codon:yes stop_codon:yes gene_type:complete